MSKVYSPEQKTIRIRLAFFLITLIFFILVSLFAAGVIINSHRINDIQASRVESCKSTYRGVRKVLKPFYPKKPWTKEQAADIQKFNAYIMTLIRRCDKQTDPSKVNDKPIGNSDA